MSVLTGMRPPALDGILETALYVADMERAVAFYQGTLGLSPLTADARLHAYDVGGRSVLLLFKKGTTQETVHLPGGTIPPHGGEGEIHLAFSIGREALDAWEQHLQAAGVAVEGRTRWPRGGTSLYVRDPDGHLVEFATPGIWTIY